MPYLVIIGSEQLPTHIFMFACIVCVCHRLSGPYHIAHSQASLAQDRTPSVCHACTVSKEEAISCHHRVRAATDSHFHVCVYSVRVSSAEWPVSHRTLAGIGKAGQDTIRASRVHGLKRGGHMLSSSGQSSYRLTFSCLRAWCACVIG